MRGAIQEIGGVRHTLNPHWAAHHQFAGIELHAHAQFLFWQRPDFPLDAFEAALGRNGQAQVYAELRLRGQRIETPERRGISGRDGQRQQKPQAGRSDAHSWPPEVFQASDAGLELGVGRNVQHHQAGGRQAAEIPGLTGGEQRHQMFHTRIMAD